MASNPIREMCKLMMISLRHGLGKIRFFQSIDRQSNTYKLYAYRMNNQDSILMTRTSENEYSLLYYLFHFTFETWPTSRLLIHSQIQRYRYSYKQAQVREINICNALRIISSKSNDPAWLDLLNGIKMKRQWWRPSVSDVLDSG